MLNAAGHATGTGAIEIRLFQPADQDAVIRLWSACGLTRPWNNPVRDIERKSAASPEGFFVAFRGSELVGSIMAGYDGHRGWINYLGVHPSLQRQGIAAALMRCGEVYLVRQGCPKINLQLRRGNETAMAFYRALGYVVDDVVSLGRRLEADAPPSDR